MSSGPERTCAGCGRKAPKGELIRFVAHEGALTPGAQAPGRGVYTCRRLQCFERAAANRGFARTLRTPGPASIGTCLASTLVRREMADSKGNNRPKRPVRPRQAPGGRKRRVVIDSGSNRGRQDSRQARDRAEARPKAPPGPAADRSRHRQLGRHGQGPLAGARCSGGPDHQDPDGPRHDGDDHADPLRRGRLADRRRGQARRDDQARRRGGRGLGGLRGRRGRPRRAASGGDDHGPRRPRQDDAPGRDSRGVGRRDRGRWDHPAHRGLPGAARRPQDHLPGHARPRSVHGDARPRREGDGHRRARRRSR